MQPALAAQRAREATPQRTSSPLSKNWAGALGSIAVVLVVWWLLSLTQFVPKSLFPSPLDTARAAAEMWRQGVLLEDLAISLRRALAGFALGSLLGIAVGFITGRITPIALIVTPIVSFLRPIPVIALVPLVTAWFGIGEDAKRMIIAYAVFLAVWLYVHDAVARTPELHLRVAAMFGASRLRTVWSVLVPSAAPAIVTALRYGSSIAFLALVAAELGGTQQGIAYRIGVDGQFLQTDRIFVGLIILGLLGTLSDALISFAGTRLIKWSN